MKLRIVFLTLIVVKEGILYHFTGYMLIVFRAISEHFCGDLHRLCRGVPEQGELGLRDDDVLVLLHGTHAAVAIHHCK